MELSCLNLSLSLTIVLFVTNPCLTPTQGLYYADQWVGVNSHFKILVNERRFREQLALNAERQEVARKSRHKNASYKGRDSAYMPRVYRSRRIPSVIFHQAHKKQQGISHVSSQGRNRR